MILGFSGSRQGMTPQQYITVKTLFLELGLTVLHHGDDRGADAEAHFLARVMKAGVILHPPLNPVGRAFCAGALETRAPAPYLKRNRQIVVEGIEGFVAAPKEMTKPQNLRGQGTWTTLGYAEQANRRRWLVFPNGSYKLYDPKKLSL